MARRCWCAVFAMGSVLALFGCADTSKGSHEPADGAVPGQILPRALERIASPERRAQIRTSPIRVDAVGWDAEPGQALRPDAPEAYASGFRTNSLEDIAGGRLRTEVHRWHVYPQRSAEFTYTDVIDRGEGVTVGRDGHFGPPFTPPFPPVRMFAARVSAELKRVWMTQPLRLLERASEHAVSAELVPYGGRQQYALVVPGAVLDLPEMSEPIRIFVDATNYEVTATEAIEHDPVYGSLRFTVSFGGEKSRVGCDGQELSDVRFPSRLTYSIQPTSGDRTHRIHFEERMLVDVCPSVDPAMLSVPADPPLEFPEGPEHRARGLRSSEWFLRMRAFGAAMDIDFDVLLPKIVNLDTQPAPGVFLVSAITHNVVVIEMPTYLVVVEAPVNDRVSEIVLAALRARWGDTKPVRYVINTHYHHDHAGGLRHYVDQGIGLIAPDNTHSYYRGLYGIDAIAVPRNGPPHRLSDGERTVEIYAVDDPHAEGNLLVYLPKERLLINADLFSPGEFDPNVDQRDPGFLIPPLGFFFDAAVQLHDQTLPRLGLQPQLFVGIHGTSGSPQDFERALGRRVTSR